MVQQRALGSEGSWEAAGGQPNGNSFSSGAGRGSLAELEAILRFQTREGLSRRAEALWSL